MRPADRRVPIGILVALAAPRILRESHGADRSRSYDIPGAVTITLALVLLVDALVGTTSNGWASARTNGELLGAVALLGIFLAIEGRFGLKVWFRRRWCPRGERPPWAYVDNYEWCRLYAAVEPLREREGCPGRGPRGLTPGHPSLAASVHRLVRGSRRAWLPRREL